MSEISGEAGEAPGTTRGGVALRAVLLALACAVLLAGVGAAAFFASLAPARRGAAPVLFDVPRGASLTSVARDLESAGLVRNARSLVAWARLHGQGVRAGQYELSAALPAREILAILSQGRVKHWDVTIPEGLRLEEVAERLAAAGLADRASFTAYARDPASARALGVEGPTLEGYLFPETYLLARGLPASEVAAILVRQFQDAWRPLAVLAAERGLSMREVVTLASIVEKETGAAAERPLIASVFLNRLARGMRLDSDPTVIYGITGFDGNLRRVHLEDETNAYNTYRIAGLPPGPIASPGADSLRAVLEPATTPYVYFVARGDGTHQFSRTQAEHTAAVDRYQRRRRRAP